MMQTDEEMVTREAGKYWWVLLLGVFTVTRGTALVLAAVDHHQAHGGRGRAAARPVARAELIGRGASGPGLARRSSGQLLSARAGSSFRSRHTPARSGEPAGR